MPANDYRMMAVYRELTAMERARLMLRLWLLDEPLDPDVVRLMPAGQKAEYERLTRRVEGANGNASFHLSFWQHWLIELETTLGWLHSLRAWEARLQRLKAALPAKERAHFVALLGPAPQARWGMAHGLDLLYGSVLPDVREESNGVRALARRA